MKKNLIITALLCCACFMLNAQEFEYKLRAGFGIGGSSPIPLPFEIRKIKSYNPALALSLEGSANYWVTYNFGILSGLRFEIKGMTTRASVKNYHIIMNISEGEQEGMVNGMFTGDVETKVNNQYITLPLLATYRFNGE